MCPIKIKVQKEAKTLRNEENEQIQECLDNSRTKLEYVQCSASFTIQAHSAFIQLMVLLNDCSLSAFWLL
jgi:hypothetical protein